MTNKTIKYNIKHDLDKYHRKLKIAAYFSNRSSSIPPRFIPTSQWSPPLDSIPPIINKIIQEDTRYFTSLFKMSKLAPNITREEHQALISLKNNKTIVIKPADKGSAVVIMNRNQYIWEVNRQLSDKMFYMQLIKPIYSESPYGGKHNS